MTSGKLCELCPIENASMDDRTIIQWNKDDLDELGILNELDNSNSVDEWGPLYKMES